MGNMYFSRKLLWYNILKCYIWKNVKVEKN